MKLLLHAGTHKTATTSIQKVLYENRIWLRERGLFFPNEQPFIGPSGHLEFTHALTESRGAKIKAAREYIRSVKSKVAQNETTILSSEAVFRHVTGRKDLGAYIDVNYLEGRSEYLAKLATALSDFDVEVILCFRDEKYFTRWLHKKLFRADVWNGSLAEFRDEFGERFSHRRSWELFQKHFSRVTTFRFENSIESGIVSSFFDVIGYPAPPHSDEVWERPSKPRVVQAG